MKIIEGIAIGRRNTICGRLLQHLLGCVSPTATDYDYYQLYITRTHIGECLDNIHTETEIKAFFKYENNYTIIDCYADEVLKVIVVSDTKVFLEYRKGSCSLTGKQMNKFLTSIHEAYTFFNDGCTYKNKYM